VRWSDRSLRSYDKLFLEEIVTDHDSKYALPGGGTRSEKAPPYHLVPREGLRRTAKRFGFGAEKHGEWNWLKSTETRELAAGWATEAYNHMMEHAMKMAAGLDPDDDHLGAIGWAQTVLCFIEEKYQCKWTDLLKK
jgi:hypothetical protein